jgi:hypothetical protein
VCLTCHSNQEVEHKWKAEAEISKAAGHKKWSSPCINCLQIYFCPSCPDCKARDNHTHYYYCLHCDAVALTDDSHLCQPCSDKAKLPVSSTDEREKAPTDDQRKTRSKRKKDQEVKKDSKPKEDDETKCKFCKKKFSCAICSTKDCMHPCQDCYSNHAISVAASATRKTEAEQPSISVATREIPSKKMEEQPKAGGVKRKAEVHDLQLEEDWNRIKAEHGAAHACKIGSVSVGVVFSDADVNPSLKSSWEQIKAQFEVPHSCKIGTKSIGVVFIDTVDKHFSK